MLFNSYIFIFLFLPMALAGYFLINRFGQDKPAKSFLIGMSLWFYAYFELSYLWIILASIVWNYCIHLLIVKNRKCARPAEWIGILGNLGILFYFKYFDFVVENINAIAHTNLSLLKLLFPLGISFFTFQQIGFLVDTARGELEQKSPIDYALFVVFFPQLVAGPIVSSEEMLPQFEAKENKQFRPDSFLMGITLFVFGLTKKVLLADTIGKAVDWGYSYHTYLYGINGVLVILLYSFQLYFDFSGYCDMARGIGKMFNIELPVNFNSPFRAEDIMDFWDRWHMTLTRFFTRYVYIPLGGNRKGTARTYLNVLIVFALSGLWHGANWTFIVWGILHGILSVLTRMCKKVAKPGRGKWLRQALTFLFVAFAFGIFRADSLAQFLEIVKSITDFRGGTIMLEITSMFETIEWKAVLKLLHLYNVHYISYLYAGVTVVIGAVIIWLMPNAAELEKNYLPKWFESKRAGWLMVGLAILAIWSIVSMAGVSSFLYFNF